MLDKFSTPFYMGIFWEVSPSEWVLVLTIISEVLEARNSRESKKDIIFCQFSLSVTDVVV